ncbi:MAG TPA: CpsB/CapC family capsule biosynthesis tyrosine phosphatase [Gemmatimonadaceae bacterium]|nr:CpsB/CapC family capsule biosynthesis tyrosine phosphatase [Gemmatimonadaceae bacterium]
MIDIHTHLLPGVDDGSQSFETSAAVLTRFAHEGVRAVVCTPHLDASRAGAVDLVYYGELLAALRAHIPPSVTLRLFPGWEIKLDRPGCDLTRKELSLGGSRAVLVEFPYGPLPPGANEEIARLCSTGIVPIVAHPDRYQECTTAHVRAWRASGAVIQTDGRMLLGGGPHADFAHSLVEEGLVDILASDNHGDLRSVATVREWLKELGASEAAELLTSENPRRVLENERPLKVPSITIQRGLLRRLRDLMFPST